MMFNSRPLLALPLMAPLFGCASKPEGPPIVLHPPKMTTHRTPVRPRTEPRTANVRPAAVPSSAAPQADAPAAASPASAPDQPALSSDQKETLFRDFDTYLNQPGGH